MYIPKNFLKPDSRHVPTAGHRAQSTQTIRLLLKLAHATVLQVHLNLCHFEQATRKTAEQSLETS